MNSCFEVTDTGTLDVSFGTEFPDFDLSGNPRITGDHVDMGAYEYISTEITNNQLPVTNDRLTNYPNPFNPSTTISFSTTEITEFTEIKIEIYNIKGQKVKTLFPSLCHPEPVEGRDAKNQYSVTWNGKDENGNLVTSGVYLYKLKAGDYQKVKKMVMLK